MPDEKPIDDESPDDPRPVPISPDDVEAAASFWAEHAPPEFAELVDAGPDDVEED